MKKHMKLIFIFLALAAILFLTFFLRMKFVYILLAILVLAFIIFFHELGHFTMGKLLGFRVLDFSLGFGPALIKFKKGETTYAFRAIPFGGACQFDGEDEEAENGKPGGNAAAPAGSVTESTEHAAAENGGKRKHAAKRFNAQPVWKRFLVIFAGPFMNILLAFLIAFVLFLVQPKYEYAADSDTGDLIPQITEVIKDEPADRAGLKAGDIVTAVNGLSLFKADEETGIDALVRLIGGAGNDMTLTVKRGDETLDIAVTGAYDPETNTSKIGITIGALIDEASVRHRKVWEAAGEAGKYLVFIVKATAQGISNMFKNGIHQGDVAGVVGTVGIMVQVAEQSVSMLVSIAVILSLSLGLFNLIPFPALDGGRLLFLIIEGIRRKPLNRKVEGIVNAVGLMLLFGLMIVVTVFDVIGLFK